MTGVVLPGPPPPRGPGVQAPFVAPPTDGRRRRRWWAIGLTAGAVVLCCAGSVAGLGGLDGRAVGSGVSGPDGVASFTEVFFGLPIGVIPDGVRASFAGSPALGASTATASLTVQAINPADLSVSASLMASTVPVTVGSNVVYVVSMANNGPSSASELRLNVTLPAGVQLAAAAGQDALLLSAAAALERLLA